MVEKEIVFEEILVYLNKLYERSQGLKEYEESLGTYKEKIIELEHKLKDVTTENIRLAKRVLYDGK